MTSDMLDELRFRNPDLSEDEIIEQWLKADEDLINPRLPDIEGDIPGISEPNIIDEIIKGGDTPTPPRGPSVKSILETGDEHRSIKDLNEAWRQFEGELPGGEGSGFFYARLADEAQDTQRLMQDASVDDLQDFMDLVFDDLARLGGGSEGPLEHTMMASLVKHELLAKAILGENAVGGIEESLKAFNVFDEVLFPEIPSSTLRANLRDMFDASQNEVEALKFMWNTSRGR
jgi:hypothetical protein